MQTYQIVRHIVVDGDKPLKAAGVPLWSFRGGKIQYNVTLGEPVAYLEKNDGTVPQTIDVAGITADNIHQLRLGVGHSNTGGKIVDSVRHFGSEEIGNCDIEDGSVASPSCGNPSVEDLYFNCVSCDENYAIEVGMRDNFTQSYAPMNKDYGNYYASYTPNCKKCNDCDREVTCDEIASGLLDNLLQPNGRTLPDGQPYPDYTHPVDDFPFDVHKIHSRALVGCLAFNSPADCEDCNELAAFDSITVGANTIDVSDIVTPTDDSAVYRGQLEQIEAIINDAFDADATVNGRAYITGVNYNTCCPLQLHVNTDDAAFAVALNDGAGGTTALTFTETDPFATGQPGEGYTCGIRVIGAALSGDCDCLINRPLAMYGRKVRIQAIGGGFEDAKSATIQKMEFPGQFGTLIQYQELEQTRGGSGRDYGGGQAGTWLGGPREDAKVRRAITAKCDKDYCSYHVRSRYHFLDQGGNKNSHSVASYVHVESDATAANADIKALLDKWATLSVSCADVPVFTCAPLSTTCA